MKRVLVIDDSRVMRHAICDTLAAAGYETVEAADGVEGLAAMSHTSGIDLAVCDVNMPRMDGLELLAEAQRAGLATPILMLTAERQPAMLDKAREAGAKGWIVKPVEPERLLMAVRTLIGDAAA